jgi:Zn-dependent peptidase ImmA (M78 family)
MTLRRGFKTEANAIAREVRLELGLQLYDRLDPWKLAKHLEVPVIGLSDYSLDAPFAVTHFQTVESAAFSAVTVFSGHVRVVVHNDSHVPGRQCSNLAHELSHALLLHPPAPALDLYGCRDWDEGVEREADWLAGALLISEEAALRAARQNLGDFEIAESYGISVKMARYRMNVTAARRRINRGQRG